MWSVLCHSAEEDSRPDPWHRCWQTSSKINHLSLTIWTGGPFFTKIKIQLCLTKNLLKAKNDWSKSDLNVCMLKKIIIKKRMCDIFQLWLLGGQAQNSASSTGKSPGAFPFRKQKRIPAALKEVGAPLPLGTIELKCHAFQLFRGFKCPRCISQLCLCVCWLSTS